MISSILSAEIDRVAVAIAATPELLLSGHVLGSYAAEGLDVVADPFDARIADEVIAALRSRKPFSAVRIGDGEANLLSVGAYGTPELDRACVAEFMAMQHDRIVPTDMWAMVFRELMLSSILQADIVGVLGLWRAKPLSTEELLALLRENPRGASGAWRAIDLMIKLARRGILKGKLVTSAHLYFGIVQRLEPILSEVREALLITNRSTLRERFAARFPKTHFDLITIGDSPNAATPDFLLRTEGKLPGDLTGRCCLIGAGPWAEVYCGWVKQRGGVAVDIGSGFDLMDGAITRPIHVALGLDRTNPFAM